MFGGKGESKRFACMVVNLTTSVKLPWKEGMKVYWSYFIRYRRLASRFGHEICNHGLPYSSNWWYKVEYSRKKQFSCFQTVYLLSLIALTSCKRNQLGNSDVVKTPHVFNLQGGRGGFKKFAKRVDVRFSII